LFNLLRDLLPLWLLVSDGGVMCGVM
jgi:hypothetical protein